MADARGREQELERLRRQAKLAWRKYFGERDARMRQSQTFYRVLQQVRVAARRDGGEGGAPFFVADAAFRHFRDAGETMCPLCLETLAYVDLRRPESALVRAAVMGKCGHVFCGGCAARVAGQPCAMRCGKTPFETVTLDRSVAGIAADVVFHVVSAVADAPDADHVADLGSMEGFAGMCAQNVSNGSGPEDAVQRALTVLRGLTFFGELMPDTVAKVELVLRQVHGASVPEPLRSASETPPTPQQQRDVIAAAAESRKRLRSESSSDGESGGKRQAVGDGAVGVAELKARLEVREWAVIAARFDGTCAGTCANKTTASGSAIAARKGKGKLVWLCAACATACAR